MSPPDDDRDRRRYGDPLHPRAGERRPSEVDEDQLRRDVDHGMPDWAEFQAMRSEVKLCAGERLKRERRRKWLIGALGGSGAAFCAATVWVVTTIRDAGASAERAQVQAEIVRDTATRVRVMEADLAALRALVNAFLARRGGHDPSE